MSSRKQIVANRLNAQQSTGPQTEQGKAIVSRNALKHGMLAESMLVPGEKACDLKALGEALVAALEPEDGLEQLLAEDMLTAAWRLRRAGRFEARILKHMETRARRNSATFPGAPGRESTSPFAEAEAMLRCLSVDVPAKLSRYEGSLRRAMYKALHELQRLRAARRGRDVPAPIALDVDVATDDSES